MKKEELILKIQEKFDDEDLILIKKLYDFWDKERESARNEALLRALHDVKLEPNSEESLEKIIRDLAVSMTHYIFRNGSVENFHAGEFSFRDFSDIPIGTPVENISQLTDSDMKILNKEMVDKIGFLLNLFAKADYSHIKPHHEYRKKLRLWS